MTPVAYVDAVRAILDHLQTTQLDAIEAAADLVIHALLHKGTVRCAAIGHGNEQDFINRAGGLAAVQPFKVRIEAQEPLPNCLRDRPRPEPLDADVERVRAAVRTSTLRAGDVMLIGSVSGKSRHPIELALACREIGVRVVGFTSLAYTAKVESLHPSGKKLCDVADVVIDNGAPYGDAAVDVPGYAEKMLPVSGVAMIVSGWMIWGRVMEKMAAAGDPPSVFISVNREGGREFYDKAWQQYQDRGY